ncbi:MAG: monofunctional biosynthetic peptidoglycan transglycosylase [Desulfosarcinaceae bacterium]|nr:monofunctional biosynthetic peptidoglycan transglycosylase [Desulfosarcinaceae bacterium]
MHPRAEAYYDPEMARLKARKRRTRGGRPNRRSPARLLIILVTLPCLVSLLAVVPLRWLNPPTTSFILQDGAAVDKWVYRRWTPLAEISAHLPLAVIAAEDQKFPLHHGFDLQAIQSALEEKGRRRGASTISQQLAKNLYLWPGRSWVRKGLEAWLTLLMEISWPKRRILEIYLNTVEFGPGVYGATAASRRFYGRSPGHLDARQAALLAAVLPSPKRMSAHSPSPYVNQRATTIMGWMEKLGGRRYLPR